MKRFLDNDLELGCLSNLEFPYRSLRWGPRQHCHLIQGPPADNEDYRSSGEQVNSSGAKRKRLIFFQQHHQKKMTDLHHCYLSTPKRRFDH